MHGTIMKGSSTPLAGQPTSNVKFCKISVKCVILFFFALLLLTFLFITLSSWKLNSYEQFWDGINNSENRYVESIFRYPSQTNDSQFNNWVNEGNNSVNVEHSIENNIAKQYTQVFEVVIPFNRTTGYITTTMKANMSISDLNNQNTSGQRARAETKATRSTNPPAISNQSTSACVDCFTHNFNYVIHNDKICSEYFSQQTIDLLIFVLTIHSNIEIRDTLRSTWLTYTRNNTSNVRYVFLLGEIQDGSLRNKVVMENELYHDIIKEDFVDTYMNLTLKTIMGLKWTTEKCSQARYVMKTDDDMFVNIPNLLKAIDLFGSNLHEKVFGLCHQIAYPIRDSKSKWFASIESYPNQTYPGFCSGTGYAMDMHVAKKILEISPSVPFFHLEDVYIAICVRKLGFRLHRIIGFNSDRPLVDPCVYKGDILITAHELTPAMLATVWNTKCEKIT